LTSALVSGESPRCHDGRPWLSDFGTREVVASTWNGEANVIALWRAELVQSI
jgi:hypothetical protein